MINLLKNQKGYVAFFITILILSALLGIALSITILTWSGQKISANITKSTQAYYAAEAGIEDSLLRVFAGIPYLDTNTLIIGGATVTTDIELVSTSLKVQSQGNYDQRIRNLEVNAQITSSEANFYYGVQVGEGGLTMMGNSEILGNVYSNGPIVGSGNSAIYGDAFVAGMAGFISDMEIYKSTPAEEDGNAHANSIFNSDIENGAYYQTISNSSAAAYFPGSPDPEPEEMPITDAQILEWKNDAAERGTIMGYSLSGTSDSLGPIKVVGDFTMDSNAILTQTGTIWVTGDFIIDSNVVIELADSYGLSSGLIIVDGQILLSSNIVVCGSEGYKSVGNTCYDNEGSFLMFLSTNPSLSPVSPAILSASNIEAAILYAHQGMVRLNATAQLKEVTGYALYLDSNSTVSYESGLANVNFISGPGGGWEIIDWQEIE